MNTDSNHTDSSIATDYVQKFIRSRSLKVKLFANIRQLKRQQGKIITSQKSKINYLLGISDTSVTNTSILNIFRILLNNLANTKLTCSVNTSPKRSFPSFQPQPVGLIFVSCNVFQYVICK